MNLGPREQPPALGQPAERRTAQKEISENLLIDTGNRRSAGLAIETMGKKEEKRYKIHRPGGLPPRYE